MPSVVLAGGASGQATTVKVSQIETEGEYNEARAAWMTRCEADMAESVELFINSMVVLVIAPYETDAIQQKLKRVVFVERA